jgi:predicted outer membrane repeat protein
MKTLLSLVAFFSMCAVSFAQTHISPGNVSGTWTVSGSPYLIEGEISIPSGQTLNIEPGVLIEFQGHYTLFVQGRLLAIGTEPNNITFTINDTTGFYDPNSPLGGWYGIRFVNTPVQNDSSKIIYCKLQYGKALGTDWTLNAGGAICIVDFDKVKISNSSLSHCSATRAGGAIYIWNSELRIYNCEFDNNWSLWGGGIFSFRSETYLKDCAFTENSSENGGAIYASTGSLELNYVSFTQNSSNIGGGICALNTNIQIDSCFFAENNAATNSGAINYDIDTSNVSPLYQFKVVNSGFTANSAGQYYGCIKIMQSDTLPSLINVFIDKCKFENSIANRTGAIRLDGNIWDFVISNSLFRYNIASTQSACSFWRGARGKIFNCLFDSNIAQIGLGSVALSANCDVNFINCTFVNNRGVTSGGLTIHQKSSSIVINSIFWENYPDQISLQSPNDTSVSTLYLDYNDIQYGIDSIHIDPISVLNWGVGNIDSYPLFLDTLNNDYHLQDLSPCIAAGIDSIEIAGNWYYCPSTDIEGNPRPNPPGSIPDMGAYESQFPVTVEEGYLGLPADYALFQNYPNPFNPNTVISYQLPISSKVILKIFDVLGKEVATLVNEFKSAGKYEVEFNAMDLPSGVYFCQLKAENFTRTKKMIFLK